MARRVWVKNPRVKGGGYYRTIKTKGGGQVRTHRVKGMPGERGGSDLEVTRRNIKDFKKKLRTTKSPRTRQAIKRSLKAHRQFEKDILSGKERNVTVVPGRAAKAGDKQPRSTRPPKSRKPKKTGVIKQPASTPAERTRRALGGGKLSGPAARTEQALSGKKRRVTKSTVKKAQGKKRTLSDAQKAAKRARAKARRAKRRK